MGLTPVFCCLRTDSCLEETVEEVIYIVYFRSSISLTVLNGSDWIFTLEHSPPKREREGQTAERTLCLPPWKLQCALVEEEEEKGLDRKVKYWCKGLLMTRDLKTRRFWMASSTASMAGLSASDVVFISVNCSISLMGESQII